MFVWKENVEGEQKGTGKGTHHFHVDVFKKIPLNVKMLWKKAQQGKRLKQYD